MKSMHMAAWVLVMVGALNWGLVGIGALVGSNLNVVDLLLGNWPMVEAIVFVLVGAAAVYEIVKHKGMCKECNAPAAM